MKGPSALPGSRWRVVVVLTVAAVAQSCGTAGPGANDSAAAITQTHEMGDLRLELTLDKAALTTVESALLRIEIECPEGDSIDFPKLNDGLGDFAVTQVQTLPMRLLEGGRVVHGREYELQPFLPGEYEVPALTVVSNGADEIATDPLKVSVESVLEDPESAELREIADPVDMPVPWWWWVLAALATCAALAAAGWWWYRRRQTQSVPRRVTAHEAALAKLDALLAENLLAEGYLKLFYLRLSDIVRHYIEDRFGLRAPEQTTDEFLTALANAPQIRGDHQQLLRRFLRQADMVKFAKFVPGADETGGAVDAARRFIEQTVPDNAVPSDEN